MTVGSFGLTGSIRVNRGLPGRPESDRHLYAGFEETDMLRGEFEAAGESTPTALHEAYLDRLRETVETVGAETVGKRSGVDDEVILGLAEGEAPELTLEAAAAIIAADPEMPPGESIAAEARDILLMGMTTAVVDVDALAAGLDIDRDPKELQQKVEGRYPVTLAEYAHIHAFLERQ